MCAVNRGLEEAGNGGRVVGNGGHGGPTIRLCRNDLADRFFDDCDEFVGFLFGGDEGWGDADPVVGGAGERSGGL